MENIWRIEAGDCLEAIDDLRMEDEPHQQIITSGKHYAVKAVYPLIPAVVIVDDTGQDNRITLDYIGLFRQLDAHQ